MKRGCILVFLLLVGSVYATWTVDINGDGCIDSDDVDEVALRNNSIVDLEYDVNNDNVVNDQDILILNTYIERGIPTEACDGYSCIPEECNAEDDDCDGNVDEDKVMCEENYICNNGECVFNAGKCFDSDENNSFIQGRALGTTPEDLYTDAFENCYERDIYSRLREVDDCYGPDCIMMEFFCNDIEELENELVFCEYGCKLGKCRNITKKCTEDDNGLDIIKKSEGYFEDIQLFDKCIDSNNDSVFETLIEYECVEEFDSVTRLLIEDYNMYEITCKCKNGRCINVGDTPCIDTDGNNQFKKGYTLGELAEGGSIDGFDYCFVDGQPIDACLGEECKILEYSCYKDKVMKYIHECPNGCQNGMCAGTECIYSEFFVVSQISSLIYDENCDILPKPGDSYDQPSDKFGKINDFACCSGSSEAYCVYQGKCYASSKGTNYYDFGEIVVCGCSDTSCSLVDGNHKGFWYDLDSSQDICEGVIGTCNINWYPETGFKWLRPGEERKPEHTVWEYSSDTVECCGDDSGEFIVCAGIDCICCDSASDQNQNGVCVEETGEVITQELVNQKTDSKSIFQPGIKGKEKTQNNTVFIVVVAMVLVIIFVLTLFGVRDK